jgi:hypothetical protein
MLVCLRIRRDGEYMLTVIVNETTHTGAPSITVFGPTKHTKLQSHLDSRDPAWRSSILTCPINSLVHNVH